LLEIQLARIEQLDEHVAKLDERIDARLAPYREQHTRLTGIPGVDRVVAATIVAELGTDMSVFKDAAHLAAWAGVSPGNNESAGKRKRGPTRKGNVHLMTALVEAAHGASSTRGSYLLLRSISCCIATPIATGVSSCFFPLIAALFFMTAPLPRGALVLADLILRPAEEPSLLHDFNRARGIPAVPHV
jgi:hypothetical protein